MKGLEGHIHRRFPVSSRDARSMAVSDWGISQTARIISSPAVRARSSLSGRLRKSDYQMVAVAEALYRNFGLKRVFYSAFIKVNEDCLLPDLPDGPPLLQRTSSVSGRLAAALLWISGAGELLSQKHPNFNMFLDPKCDWATCSIWNIFRWR